MKGKTFHDDASRKGEARTASSHGKLVCWGFKGGWEKLRIAAEVLRFLSTLFRRSGDVCK